MKERPIIFSTEMVKAILDGRKIMTRRVIKPQPIKKGNLGEWGITKSKGISLPLCLGVDEKQLTECMLKYSPYGQVGDRLWVRETWAVIKLVDNTKPRDIKNYNFSPIWYKGQPDYSQHLISPWPQGNRGKWRPSIFMPRWASRLTLDITEVRVERLQEITEEDAQAEGVLWCREGATPDARHHFMVLWNSLNAKRGYGWELNPWVWVIKFDNIGVRVK